jgi:NAD(P)-dependent dehydrogenase (short-subunit alcohol dehydrogenase family)
MGRLDGRVALVTGGARGIGRAIADGLAAEGARIVIADVDGAAEAAAAFDGGVGLTADVSAEADVSRMVEEALAACGRVDVLVNNAGLFATLAMRPFTEIPLEEWRRVMDVNVASVFLCSRALVPHLRAAGGGAIVNVSSGTPFRGVPFMLHYVTSKGAIVALTRALARELGADGIRVNCVAPGPVYTPMVYAGGMTEAVRERRRLASALQREGTGWDIGHAVRFLLSDHARYVTGQTLVVDGGTTLTAPERDSR